MSFFQFIFPAAIILNTVIVWIANSSTAGETSISPALFRYLVYFIAICCLVFGFSNFGKKCYDVRTHESRIKKCFIGYLLTISSIGFILLGCSVFQTMSFSMMENVLFSGFNMGSQKKTHRSSW